MATTDRDTPRIVEKANCVTVCIGNAVVGSFAGPDCGSHAETFRAALDQPVATGLTGAQIDVLIGDSDGVWHEDVFHIEGAALSCLLHDAVEAACQLAALAAPPVEQQALVWIPVGRKYRGFEDLTLPPLDLPVLVTVDLDHGAKNYRENQLRVYEAARIGHDYGWKWKTQGPWPLAIEEGFIKVIGWAHKPIPMGSTPPAPAPQPAPQAGAATYTAADVTDAHAKGYRLGLAQLDHPTEQPSQDAACGAWVATLDVDDGGNIEFETARAGWLLPKGSYRLHLAARAAQAQAQGEKGGAA